MKRAVPISFALMFAVFFPVMNAQAKQTKQEMLDTNENISVKVIETSRVNEPLKAEDFNYDFHRVTVHIVLQANKTIYKAHLTCGDIERESGHCKSGLASCWRNSECFGIRRLDLHGRS